MTSCDRRVFQSEPRVLSPFRTVSHWPQPNADNDGKEEAGADLLEGNALSIGSMTATGQGYPSRGRICSRNRPHKNERPSHLCDLGNAPDPSIRCVATLLIGLFGQAR